MAEATPSAILHRTEVHGFHALSTLVHGNLPEWVPNLNLRILHREGIVYLCFATITIPRVE